MAQRAGYLDRLNEKQREAALCTEGPLLILAGAGSGKTSTMTCRIAHLIEEGVSPYQILAVTFTNKAAREMRDRVEALLSEMSGREAAEADMGSMWIQTFHSACLRILRMNAERIGFERNFVVYDTQDQKTVMKSIMKEQQIDEKQYKPAYLLSVISDCKNKEQSAEQYLNSNGENPRSKAIYRAYSAYEKVLRKNNAMDFDDLLLNAVRLLRENEDVLLRYQNRFRYVMVDEYQDTNYIQYQFVRLLAQKHRNLCVVGDDDQCIYEWRGADIRNILDFEKDFHGAKVIKLEQNYRSWGNILDAAHSVIENNKGRKQKKLWTARASGDKIVYYRADNEKDEAAYIASEIDHLVGQVFPVGSDGDKAKNGDSLEYRDVAILYRTNAQSRTFEEAFTRRKIPYRVLGGMRYYDRKEIKDMMAYMRLVLNPADDLSFVRIINEPKRGVGEKTLEKLRTLAAVRGESLFQTLCDEDVASGLSGKSAASVAEMMRVLTEIEREKENLRVSDIYEALLKKTGYYDALEIQNTVESEGRIENLMEFRSVIVDYEQEDSMLSLADFLERIALFAEIDNHDASEDTVTLMTMHSAKGLEFPIVFLPGMEDGLFPGWRAKERPEGLEEERRLCYVGMTRAKDRLYLTGAETRTMYGRTDYTRESQFLREIDKKLLTGDAVFEGKKESAFGSAGEYVGTEPPAKPFDSLKYAKQEVKRNTAPKETSYQAGDSVMHGKFGKGLVISADEKIVSVMFDSVGMKKLAKDIAPLTKLS